MFSIEPKFALAKCHEVTILKPTLQLIKELNFLYIDITVSVFLAEKYIFGEKKKFSQPNLLQIVTQ